MVSNVKFIFENLKFYLVSCMELLGYKRTLNDSARSRRKIRINLTFSYKLRLQIQATVVGASRLQLMPVLCTCHANSVTHLLLREAEGCREGWFPGNIRVIGMSLGQIGVYSTLYTVQHFYWGKKYQKGKECL